MKKGYLSLFLKVFGGLTLIGVMVFSMVTHSQNKCENIEVDFINGSQYPFLNKEDIINLANKDNQDKLFGKRINDINLSQIEERILKNSLVENCEVNSGFGNKLSISILFREPIARFADASTTKGFYINKQGDFFRLSTRFSVRTMLVSGSYFRNKTSLKDPKFSNDLVFFLNRIKNDAFWSTQIVEINIDSLRNIKLYPLVGKHVVEFGRPTNFENKLGKLQFFHQKLMFDPNFKVFKKVNVQFKDQIVCE